MSFGDWHPFKPITQIFPQRLHDLELFLNRQLMNLGNAHDNHTLPRPRYQGNCFCRTLEWSDWRLRAVDATLTAILGREAAARGAKLTMDELLKENKRLELNLAGLKL
jgi:hypothetical protein